MKHNRIDARRTVRAAAMLLGALALGAAWVAAANPAQGAPNEAMQLLAQELDKAGAGFTLGGERARETRFFYMETRLTHYEPDGTRNPGVIFRFWLELRPEEPGSGREGMTVICRKFTLTRPGGREVELPTLRDWSYYFSHATAGPDERGQIFGVPHQKFALLVDARGDLVESDTGYLVYNAFIDFHGFNDVFAVDMGASGGIQDLQQIGDVVVHAAADTEPPVGLGDAVKKGSVFRNGKVTLELKGVSLVDGRPCALLGYDSGESSYLMYVEPMKGMDLRAEGASHYFGDLYVELGSGWLRKATLFELVVSEAQTGRGRPNHSIIERSILLETLTEADMERL